MHDAYYLLTVIGKVTIVAAVAGVGALTGRFLRSLRAPAAERSRDHTPAE